MMRMTRRHRLPATVVVALLAATACGPQTVATPQARVAHYGATVLDSVAALQRGITAAASANPAVVQAANQATDVVAKVRDVGAKLREALVAYDALTTDTPLDVRQMSEAEIHALVASIHTLLSDVLKVEFGDDRTIGEVAKLIANVVQAINTVSGALAKGWS